MNSYTKHDAPDLMICSKCSLDQGELSSQENGTIVFWPTAERVEGDQTYSQDQKTGGSAVRIYFL